MAPPLRSSKVSYQARSTRSFESAPNRKELPVTLPTLYREVRFRIREAADCRNGLLGSASLLSSQKLETFKCKSGDVVNCPSAGLKIPPMPSSARIVGLGSKLPAQVAVRETILGRSSARNAVSDSRNQKRQQSPKNSALSMPILPSTLPKRFSLQRLL